MDIVKNIYVVLWIKNNLNSFNQNLTYKSCDLLQKLNLKKMKNEDTK